MYKLAEPDGTGSKKSQRRAVVWLGAALVVLISAAWMRPSFAQDVLQDLVESTAAEDQPTTRAAPRGGQQSPIRLMAEVGFDPRTPIVKMGCWAPISVLMENDEKSFEGYLQVLIRRDDPAVIYHQPVDLPKNSRKRPFGYFLPDESAFNNELVIEYCSRRGQRIAYEPAGYIPRPIEDDLVLGIIPPLMQKGMRSFIGRPGRESSSRYGQPISTGYLGGRYLLFTDKTRLPREVLGYESISTILWDGGDLSELDTERTLALRGWVFKGGTLVVAVGENAQAVRQSFLKDLLPVEISGAESAVVADDFRRQFGSAPSDKEPMVIATARPLRGKVLLGTKERPLIVEGAYGAGRVVFVAFSLTSWTLQKWPQRDELLERLLFPPGGSRLLAALTAEGRWQMDYRIKSNLLAALPSPFFIAAFLGLYIVLVVPVNYFVFRALKRVEYAWFALPVIAIGFALLAYNIGYFSQSRTLDADEITMAEGMAGSPVVRAKTFLAIYSPTRIDETVHFQNQVVFSRPLVPTDYVQAPGRPQQGQERSRRNPLRLAYGTGFVVHDFVIYPWAARSLECDHVIDLGGQVNADLAFEVGQVRGTIANNLGYDLQGVMVLTQSGATRFPVLRSKATMQLGPDQIGARATGAGASWQNWMFEALESGRQQRGAQPQYVRSGQWGPMGPMSYGPLQLFRPAPNIYGQSWFGGSQGSLLAPETCLLLAWAPRPAIEPIIGEGRSARKVKRQSSTLIHMIVLPVGSATALSASAIGEAFWIVEPSGELNVMAGSVWGNALQDYGQATGRWEGVFPLVSSENVFVLRPRTLLGSRTVSSLTIDFQLNKKNLHGPRGTDSIRSLTGGAFDVALYDFVNKTWESFGSTAKVSVASDVNRFVDPNEKVIRMKIMVYDREVGLGSNPGQPSAVNCFLHNVRVNAVLKTQGTETSAAGGPAAGLAGPSGDSRMVEVGQL